MINTKQKEQAKVKIPKTQRKLVLSQSFQGPLPPPAILSGYESILPGAADRIIKMAEQQLAHRHSIEKEVVNSEMKSDRLGMILGCLILILLIGSGSFLILYNKPIEGLVTLVSSPALLSIVYFFRKRQSVKK